MLPTDALLLYGEDATPELHTRVVDVPRLSGAAAEANSVP